MSELFPDEKNEYRLEEKNDRVIEEVLKPLEKVRKKIGDYSGLNHVDSRSREDGFQTRERAVSVDHQDGKTRRWREFLPLSAVIYSVEFVLFIYLVLALNGVAPMF